MALLAAFQFLTLLPVKRGFTESQMGHSTAFFPVVGLVIGMILAGVNWLLGLLLPPSLINIITITLLALLSGGLHLDGLGDTLDGIAGHRSIEQRLEIMRDSRIGGVGAVGIALFLIMEYAALNSLTEFWRYLALVAAPTLSRWAMVISIFVYPYARNTGLGIPFKKSAGRTQVIIATILTLVVTLAAFRLAGVVIIISVWIVTTLVALYLVKKLGGLTGDTYGAINELATLTTFIIISMLVYRDWLLW